MVAFRHYHVHGNYVGVVLLKGAGQKIFNTT